MIYTLQTFLNDYREPDGNLLDILNKDNLEILPSCSGAYILMSIKQSFVYPGGKSKVLYIGKSKNLFKRIKTHHNNLKKIVSLKKSELCNDWYYKRYQYMRKFGCQVFWYSTRGIQDSKNLESDIMEYFYDRYLSIPIGNGSFSFRK
jgi:hypothetical protein